MTSAPPATTVVRRSAVWVMSLLSFGALAYAVVPFAHEGVECPSAIVAVARQADTAADQICSDAGVRRLWTALAAGAVAVVGMLGARALLADGPAPPPASPPPSPPTETRGTRRDPPDGSPRSASTPESRP